MVAESTEPQQRRQASWGATSKCPTDNRYVMQITSDHNYDCRYTSTHFVFCRNRASLERCTDLCGAPCPTNHITFGWPSFNVPLNPMCGLFTGDLFGLRRTGTQPNFSGGQFSFELARCAPTLSKHHRLENFRRKRGHTDKFRRNPVDVAR